MRTWFSALTPGKLKLYPVAGNSTNILPVMPSEKWGSQR